MSAEPTSGRPPEHAAPEEAAPEEAALRDELRGLVEAQVAFRRVATLVAQGAEPSEVFMAVAVEASRLLGVGAVSLVSYDAQAQTFTKIFATHGQRSVVPEGVTWRTEDSPEGALVVRTGHPGRVDDWSDIPGPIAAEHRERGFGPAVAAPIIIGGAIWGYLAAYAEAGETLSARCEDRLADFTQLMASAIANVQARDELRALAESQGALRQVATLVAQGAEPREVFTAVAVEASRLLGVGAVSLVSYDAQAQTFTKIFGTHGRRSPVPDGTTWPVDDSPEGSLVVRTGRPGRIDDWSDIPGPTAAGHREQGFGPAGAAPIIIGGGIWGYLAAYAEAGEILPPGWEYRLADYTQLMATAIANAQARDELRGLAQRQGEALRRVATLVAQRASPSTIFNAVAGEASRALGVTRVDVGRYGADRSITLLGSTGTGRPGKPTFTWSGGYVARRVMESGRVARVDDWTRLRVPEAQAAGQEGFQSVIGAPIFVNHVLWGVIVVLADEILPRDAETRLADFTHLVASSISNVQARNDLNASRARIVTASDETRRRIERNLHDGIQQRMVALALSLRAVRTHSPLPDEVEVGLDEVAHDLEGVLEEIRVFSQGLHPALLSRAGLAPSLRELARRSPIAVDLDISAGRRLPEQIEIAIYYVVSEALANAAKHSKASAVSVVVESDPARVRCTVTDDGVGGATLERGSGLIGLVDRIEALGGRFTMDSPPTRGTTISVELPLDLQPLDQRPKR
jgi:signal transduction histidine kinase